MKTRSVCAGAPISRGQYCVERPGGLWFAEPSHIGIGGIARKPYGEWPPEPIKAGEIFEILTDGGCMALIGTKSLWLEIRDGRMRYDLISPTMQGEVRAALFEIGHIL